VSLRKWRIFSSKSVLQFPKPELFYLITQIPKAYKVCYPSSVMQHAAEEVYKGLVEIGFDISVKQMSTTRRLQDSTSRNLPLFLITLPRSEKCHEIFKLTSLCYIAIQVEACKSQTGLTQCHNC
jgi:hypothetical protein